MTDMLQDLPVAEDRDGTPLLPGSVVLLTDGSGDTGEVIRADSGGGVILDINGTGSLYSCDPQYTVAIMPPPPAEHA